MRNEIVKLKDSIVRVLDKEDDKFFYVVDEEGICKNKEYNILAKVLFGIKVVGDLVVCVKKLLE